MKNGEKMRINLLNFLAGAALISSTMALADENLGSSAEKSGLFSVVASDSKTTVMVWNSDFLPFRKIGFLMDYCESIGGKGEKQEDIEAGKNSIVKLTRRMTCKNSSGDLFSSHSYGRSGNILTVVKFDKDESSFQKPMMGYISENKIGADKSYKDLNGAMLDFGTNFFDYYGLCLAKGGKYYIANENTRGKAVESNEYIIKGTASKKYLSLNLEGKQYCINTTKPNDEFTITLSPEPYNRVMRFQGSDGVDHATLKFDDPKDPFYLNLDKPKEDESVSPKDETGHVMMSQKPDAATIALAQKVLTSQKTHLARGNGSILEGMYLGSSSKGSELAAIVKRNDKPVGHNALYGADWNPMWVMNFSLVNGKVQYVGESFEKKFPQSIENEYRRVLDACKKRGMGGSSYLGYDITCERQGTDSKPEHEMTILKKDTLVLRAYEQ